MPRCSHLDSIAIVDPPDDIAGCEVCLRTGGRWVHLRMCQSCGQIGCCDSSPGRHATAHHNETGRPIIRSVEPGEDWSWCYPDALMFRLRGGDEPREHEMADSRGRGGLVAAVGAGAGEQHR